MAKTRPHGDRTKYVIEKCRCDECRRANRDYERRARRRKAYGGDYWPWVEASRARAHVRWLMAPAVGSKSGVGWRRIARLAGVSQNVVSKLIYGETRKGVANGPSRRVHRDTEAKILSVSRNDLADGATVSATPTWELIHCLKAYGIPYYRINQALGNAAPALQVSKITVNVSTAKAIERLHWGAWRASPDLQARCVCDRPDYIRALVEGMRV